MSTPSRGERCATGRLAVAVCRSCAFSDVWRWQDIDAMRSRALCRGKIPPRCVPGRSTMAKCSRSASPPSVRWWHDCSLMRSWPDWQWQYSRAMRSRGSCRGKIPPRCVPGRQSVAGFALHASRKWPRAGKSPVPGKICAPCIRKRTGFGKMCAPCIRKAPQIAVGGYTARRSCQEGALSLHGPPESCIVRRSCHRSAHERKGSGRKCLRFVKTEPKRQKMSPKVLTSF